MNEQPEQAATQSVTIEQGQIYQQFGRDWLEVTGLRRDSATGQAFVTFMIHSDDSPAFVEWSIDMVRDALMSHVLRKLTPAESSYEAWDAQREARTLRHFEDLKREVQRLDHSIDDFEEQLGSVETLLAKLGRERSSMGEGLRDMLDRISSQAQALRWQCNDWSLVVEEVITPLVWETAERATDEFVKRKED